MLVKDLIEMLTEMGVDKEIQFGCGIESGRGCYSTVNDGDVSVDHGVVLVDGEDGGMVPDLDEDGEEILDEDVVRIFIDGEEDSFQ